MNDEEAEPAIHPLVAEATKKAAVAWVEAGDKPAVALWCLWVDDALFAVCGPGEQADPGLADVDRARVILRGDHGGRVVDFPAHVSAVDPESQTWEVAAPALAAKRLNALGPDLVARWAAECVVYRLTPTADEPLHDTGLPSDSLIAEPRPSPATRKPRRPFRLHKVKPRR